jgi:hypothetical protein
MKAMGRSEQLLVPSTRTVHHHDHHTTRVRETGGSSDLTNATVTGTVGLDDPTTTYNNTTCPNTTTVTSPSHC